jgi:hypothetical protein
MVAVPNIRYATVALAEVDMDDVGLKLSIVERKETMDWQPETILTQDPKAGTLVEPGTKVKITISVLPPCDPSYPDICLTPRGPDIDCADLTARAFRVLEPDPYDLDLNDDGYGCTRRLDRGA